MGTDRTTGTDRQSVFADLASALQERRGGSHAREMAAAVFRHATGPTTLVALIDGGERVVCYDATAHTLTAVPFDEHGLDHAAAEGLWTRLSDPTTWVDARADAVDWVHPRYRWVLDGDVSVWRTTRSL